MRDIRPKHGKGDDKKEPRPKPPGALPPEVQKLYERRRPAKKLGRPIDHLAEVPATLKPPSSSPAPLPPNVPVPKKSSGTSPRLTGSSVGVSQVNVPKPETDHPSPPTIPPPKKNRSVREADRAELERFKQTLKEKQQGKKLKTRATLGKKKSPRPTLAHKERSVVAILLVLVLIAGALAAAIFLPKADVTLVLETAPLLVDQKLTLSTAGATGDNVLAATAFKEEVPLQGSAPVASREVVGTKATGVVSIVNHTVDEQKIVAQSRLVTKDGTLFYMQTHAIVPPNSSVNVPVEAAEAGEAGNVSSGRLNFAALDSSAQSLVYAEVTQPLTGGSGSEVAVVKDDDIAKAKAAAGETARQQVETKIRGQLADGWSILDESWDSQVSNFTTAATVGDQKDTIDYTADVTVRVMGYQQAQLEQSLRQALESRLDQDHMLFPGPISFTKSVDNLNWDAGTGDLSVRVTHTTIPTFSIDTLKDKIAGRKESEAQTYLEGLPGVHSASITLWPFWVQSIPRISQRVSLDLQSDR